MELIKLEAVGLSAAGVTEKMVQNQIAADPSMLGLGALIHCGSKFQQAVLFFPHEHDTRDRSGH